MIAEEEVVEDDAERWLRKNGEDGNRERWWRMTEEGSG